MLKTKFSDGLIFSESPTGSSYVVHVALLVF